MRRLPLAFLLALVFLGAFTIMQHYHPETYDVSLNLTVSGDFGCTATMSVSVAAERCYRVDCYSYDYLVHVFRMDADASVDITGSCPPPSAVRYFASAGEMMEFYAYLCRGASNATRFAVRPPDGRRGLLRAGDITGYVYAQLGRVAVLTRHDPAAGDRTWTVRCVAGCITPCAFACYRDGEPETVYIVGWPRELHVSGTAIRGSASVLYVFVRLDQPAREVDVTARLATPVAVKVMTAWAAVPEEGPDLSDVVALYPVAVRQEYAPWVKRYYLVLEAVTRDGRAYYIEVPTDRFIAGEHWFYTYRVADVAGIPTARCEYPPQCPCTTNVTTQWRVEDWLIRELVHEPPPVSPRGGWIVLPVGRRALLFILSWPDDSPYWQPREGAFNITVRVIGARPALLRG